MAWNHSTIINLLNLRAKLNIKQTGQTRKPIALPGKEIPGCVYNRNMRSLSVEAQNGARTGLRGEDFQEGFFCASPSPICCVSGETLTVGFHLVILENRLTCSPISCIPVKLSPVPAINSSAKPQQPYFFLYIWLFDLSIRIFLFWRHNIIQFPRNL